MIDIQGALRRSHEELANSGLAEELWPAALPTVLRALLAHEEPRRLQGENSKPESVGDATDGWAHSLARKVRVPEAVLEEVFDLDDGEPHLIVPPSRLPTQKAPAMKLVSLLIAAARQGIGLDDGWTASAVLRETCKEVGVFDAANFAGELTTVDGFAFKGSGSSRKVKVTARGFEAAGTEVTRLAGSGG